MISIAERHKFILDSLKKDGFAKAADMASYWDSIALLSGKDLKYLEPKKLLYRTHGSASPVNPLASDLNVTEKEDEKKMKRNEKK
jgi:DeoR family transcriptional regulator of aga operon